MLAADIIKSPFRYGLENGTIPALIHFTAQDPVHKYTTEVFLKHQIPWLEREAKKKIKVRSLDVSDILITYPCKKPRADAIPMTHKARFQSHDVGRQVLFLSLAFNYASSLESDDVYAAFQMNPWRWEMYDEDPSEDASDDTPQFRDAINVLSEVGGFIPGQRLKTPFLDGRYSKTDIVKIGESLDVPLHLTYSCVFSAPKPCGKCNACRIYKTAVKDLGYDPRKRSACSTNV